MRVFTPTQAKSAAEERTAKDALRAKNIAEITQELIKTKDEIEIEFANTMKQQQEVAEKWFEDNTYRKNALIQEVEILEVRRKRALMPPLIKAEDIHSTSEALHARKLELDLQQSENEEESRILMQRLDEVSTREHDIDQREKRLKVKELGCETQSNQIAKDAKRLALQMADYQRQVDEKQTDFAYRESEMDARNNLLDERERGYVIRENEIQASMRLLADQRLLLEQGFKELRLKQK